MEQQDLLTVVTNHLPSNLRLLSNYFSKMLKDKAYDVAISPEYNGKQGGLASMVYKLFDKKTGPGGNINS